MASTAASHTFFSPLAPNTNARRRATPARRRHLRVLASETADDDPSATQENTRKARVDTRIHWSNPDEGWVGGGSSKKNTAAAEKQQEYSPGRFADLLYSSTETHYQFLGVEAEADMEEIKAAYRRLSKEYHPDTTALPLEKASQKFMRLREAYKVVGSEESRRFYDWTLAQEAESRRLQQMHMLLEDPRVQDIRDYVPVPEMVDRLGGKNMDLSDQAMTALTFDVGVIIFTIISIIVYVAFHSDQL